MSEKFEVTLNQLQHHAACTEGYNKLVCGLAEVPFDGLDEDDHNDYLDLGHDLNAPISLAFILDNNGLGDAVWSLYAVEGRHWDRWKFGIWVARHAGVDFKELLDVADMNADRAKEGLAALPLPATKNLTAPSALRAHAVRLAAVGRSAWSALEWIAPSFEVRNTIKERFARMLEEGWKEDGDEQG